MVLVFSRWVLGDSCPSEGIRHRNLKTPVAEGESVADEAPEGCGTTARCREMTRRACADGALYEESV